MTNSGEVTFIEKNIWDLSNEELFNAVDQGYNLLLELDKQQVKNEKSQNEEIRNQALRLEELWKRQQLPYNLSEICEKITKRLGEKNASKTFRSTVARVLDPRFKRKYTKADNDSENVVITTISQDSNEVSAQSEAIFEKIKTDFDFAEKHLQNLEPSRVQDVKERAEKFNNRTEKHCVDNNIKYVDAQSNETELDRLRSNAKGQPISCPTPEGWEQNKPKQTWGENDDQVIASFRTQKAKSIYKFAITMRNVAFNSDNYPATVGHDDEEIAKAFDVVTNFVECYNDIKIKRDNPQWAEIINRYVEISKHNAASSEDLNVYGVTCKNCGSRMKAIDKKRDEWRLYYRCRNYYSLAPEHIGCKKDLPVLRKASKERITEIQHMINQWAADVWRTMPLFWAFLYDFRNYKQPYHTEHTVLLEPKFQNRGN